MKVIRTLLVAVILSAIFGLEADAKRKTVPQFYVFGVSTSFNDSVVYITDVQEITNGWIEDKGNLLSDRDAYALQLKDYFSKQGQPNRTCVVVFSLKKKKIERKYAKLKKRYTVKSHYRIENIDGASFRFTVPAPIEE